MVKIRKLIIERVRKLLNENNMSMYALSKKAGINYETLKTLMNREDSTRLDIQIVALLAYGFDMHISEFLKGTEFDYKNLDID